jgi:hypothetical protein
VGEYELIQGIDDEIRMVDARLAGLAVAYPIAT